MLTTPGKSSLTPGAPISYRQVVIGKVLTIDLSKDASTVEAKAYITPKYVSLIRADTKFWKTAGARVMAGLGGLSVNVESVQSLIMGGVTLAIPPNPGQPVAQGQRFPLYDQPEKEWLEWVPYLSLHEVAPNASKEHPHAIHATLRWRYKNLFRLSRAAEHGAWVCPVEGGFLGPSDVLTPPDNALPDSIRWMIEGTPIALETSAYSSTNGLASLSYAHDYPAWSTDQQRLITIPEDTLIVADPATPTRFVGASRYQTHDAEWTIDPTIPFSADWHGACIVAESDRALIGVLLVDDDKVTVARLPE